jgi:hypothetical protein
MKTKSLILIVGSLLMLGVVREARAVPGLLPLRYVPGGMTTHIGTTIHNGTTTLAVGTSYGANLLGLSLTGTTTYDFYSAPLLAGVTMLTSDKGQGTVYLRNTNPTSANDFQATGRMRYYDYNPFTGTDTLIVDTGASQKNNVQHDSTAQWNMNPVPLPANYTMPAGDLLHVTVTITVVSGDPGAGAQMLYNGPKGASTLANLTYAASDNWLALDWPFASGPVASWPSTSINVWPDPAVQVCFYSTPGSNYLIQATTTLENKSSWVTIGSCVAASNGFLTYLDNDATNYPCRFYRIATP